MSSIDALARESDEEAWRAIPGFSDYEVSDRGRVRSWRPLRPGQPRPAQPRMRIPSLKHTGYLHLQLIRDDGARKSCLVHQLVLLAFKGPRPDGAIGRHVIDPCRTNNNAWNLEWGTHQDNSNDAKRHGSTSFGTKSHTAILSEEDVLCIRAQRGFISHRSLAETYGVSKLTISAIHNQHSWSCVPGKKTNRPMSGVKLHEVDVRAIYTDPSSQGSIAKKYGITQTTVSQIKLGKLWGKATAHLRADPGRYRPLRKPVQSAILELAAVTPVVAADDVVKHSGHARDSASNALFKLAKMGLLNRLGGGRYELATGKHRRSA